jgi:acetyl esterase/lipase
MGRNRRASIPISPLVHACVKATTSVGPDILQGARRETVMNKRAVVVVQYSIILALFMEVAVSASDSLIDIRLWPGDAPGLVKSDVRDSTRLEDNPDIRVADRVRSGVTVPTMSIFKPKPTAISGKPVTDMAIIVCPGGGFQTLAIDKEGYVPSRWLNSLGITSAVLLYRLEPYGDTKDVKVPLVDAQRAIRILRSRAKELKINPDRIGMMGFSAGGRLSLLAATDFDFGNPRSPDPIERFGCRPDFTMPIYPASGQDILNRITPETPPAFIVSAADDFIADHGYRYFAEAHKRSAPVEYHFFTKGGHGYGMAPEHGALSTWTVLCRDWLSETIMPLPPYHPFVPAKAIPADKTFHKRINCGSKREVQDARGYVWEGDWPYCSIDHRVDRGPIAIAGTNTPEIYRTEAWGVDKFTFSVPADTYEVALHFAETFPYESPAVGRRVFDVSINGKTVLADFDVFKEAGMKHSTAVVKTFAVDAKDGAVAIQFFAKKDQTMINGIELIGKRGI